MEQAVPASTVRRDREGVAGGVVQLDVRVLLHAQIAAGRGLAVEGSRETQCSMVIPSGRPYTRAAKPVPWHGAGKVAISPL